MFSAVRPKTLDSLCLPSPFPLHLKLSRHKKCLAISRYSSSSSSPKAIEDPLSCPFTVKAEPLPEYIPKGHMNAAQFFTKSILDFKKVRDEGQMGEGRGKQSHSTLESSQNGAKLEKIEDESKKVESESKKTENETEMELSDKSEQDDVKAGEDDKELKQTGDNIQERVKSEEELRDERVEIIRQKIRAANMKHKERGQKLWEFSTSFIPGTDPDSVDNGIHKEMPEPNIKKVVGFAVMVFVMSVLLFNAQPPSADFIYDRYGRIVDPVTGLIQHRPPFRLWRGKPITMGISSDRDTLERKIDELHQKNEELKKNLV